MMRVSAAPFILLIPVSAIPSSVLASSLCKPTERVIFSCSTGARDVSVCASKTLSKNAGYLQYRFGRRDAIDLAYPDLGARPSNVFSSGQLMFSGGGGAWVRSKVMQSSSTAS